MLSHYFLFLTPFVVVHLCLLLLSSPLLPSIFPLVTWATLAVEIKVIKDLPWPPPVGQLNTSPPVVEELESPSQTAQPPPGQTSCDQHHHGGCWCSHLPASFPLPHPPAVSSLILNASIHHLLPLMWLYLTIYPSDLIKEWYEW